jgi:SNF2 family DNA or RNA helicase
MELDERKQRYSFLTGQTTDREGQIDLFQKKHYVRYFLLGLKSGGVGLNITAANTVVFMDPWWNPAAENQAMDRAHRIGQSRNVTVYRLISEGTVEQKIANMKEIKQALADGLIDEKDLPDTGSMAGKLLD